MRIHLVYYIIFVFKLDFITNLLIKEKEFYFKRLFYKDYLLMLKIAKSNLWRLGINMQ